MTSFLIYNTVMSKWASKKKRRIIIIIGMILAILIAIISIHLETTKTFNCFDRIQNGTETGRDCGGECIKVCQEEINNLVVLWERPFKVANGVYNTIAYIENQNPYSGIQKLNYEFRLYDKDNILVSQPIQGEAFIEANKRSAIFESGIRTGDNEAYTTFFRINSLQNWSRVDQTYSYNLLTIGVPVLTNQDTAPKLSAIVRNESFINFQDIPVVVILYNSEDNAIASSRTFIDVLGQGDEVKVFYSWPEPFGDSVSRIEILPRIDPFIDRTNT
ncbi:MAG: hypothetical protein ACI870_000148 [Crocinitomicaceae bacterium]|jgi:hypothetical protein